MRAADRAAAYFARYTRVDFKIVQRATTRFGRQRWQGVHLHQPAAPLPAPGTWFPHRYVILRPDMATTNEVPGMPVRTFMYQGGGTVARSRLQDTCGGAPHVDPCDIKQIDTREHVAAARNSEHPWFAQVHPVYQLNECRDG